MLKYKMISVWFGTLTQRSRAQSPGTRRPCRRVCWNIFWGLWWLLPPEVQFVGRAMQSRQAGNILSRNSLHPHLRILRVPISKMSQALFGFVVRIECEKMEDTWPFLFTGADRVNIASPDSWV